MNKNNFANTSPLQNSDNYKRLKKIIYTFIFIIIVSQIMYHAVLFFIYFGYNPITLYIKINGEAEQNNYWIKILNFGLNHSNDGYLSFPFYRMSSLFIWIYIGSIVWWYFITPFLIYKYLYSDSDVDVQMLKCVIKSFFIVLFISSVIFLIFPIQIEGKEITEIPFNGNKFLDLLIEKSNFLLNATYKADYTRLNSLPSLHVVNSWFCYIPFRATQKKHINKKIVYIQCIIAILVFISTFAIKQHYIMDGIVSICLVELVFWWVSKNIKKKNTVYIYNSNKLALNNNLGSSQQDKVE